MTGNKKAPPIKMRLNYIYRLTMGCLCGKFVLRSTVPIIYQPFSNVQVRLFRSGKQTRSDLNEMTPIADRCPGTERIKTDIILTCIPGVVLLINNLRVILPFVAGVSFCLKKGEQ